MKLTIGKRVNGLLILFFISMAIMIAISVGSLSRVGSAALEMQEWTLINNNADQATINMLEARRHEKDFFARMDIKYATETGKSVDSAKANLAEIQKQVKSRDGELLSVTQKGMGLLDDYYSVFTKVVESNKVRGLTENDGLQGSFRNKVHTFEELVKKQNKVDLMVQMLTIRRHEKDYLLRGNEKYVKETLDTVENLKGMVTKSNLDQTTKMELLKLSDEYAKAFGEYVSVSNRIVKEEDEFRAKVHELEPILVKISEIANQRANEQVKVSDTVRERTVRFLPIIGIILLLLMIVLGTLITRSITRPLMIMSGDMESGAEQVSSASIQLSSSSQSLSQGASEQASSLEETSASLEEISSMVKQNADNSNQANQLAIAARGTAEKGAESVEKMVNAMNDINKSSSEVSKIIRVINEIAFQTNILALNAAVEAARAGDHGRGFAVVAEEVRNLAKRSAEAAKETSVLIEGSVSKASEGSKLAAESGTVLKDIVSNNKKIEDLVREIAAASKEQSDGLDQVNKAISQMDQVTQSISANSEESASSAEELSAQSNELKKMVDSLVQLVGGSRNGNIVNNDTKGRLHTFHFSAGQHPTADTRKKVLNIAKNNKMAESVIPLGEDFKEF